MLHLTNAHVSLEMFDIVLIEKLIGLNIELATLVSNWKYFLSIVQHPV